MKLWCVEIDGPCVGLRGLRCIHFTAKKHLDDQSKFVEFVSFPTLLRKGLIINFYL